MDRALNPEFLTVEQYLSGEVDSEVKHEFLGGLVYAMAGSSDAHNTIALNVAAALRAHLRGGGCRVFIADVKARLFVANRNIFYYPDVMVTCDPRDTHQDHKQHPKVIVEVLSDSTESTDRREKFWNYTQVESLEEYLLVAHDKIEVTLFARKNEWRPEILRLPNQELTLASLNFKLPVSAIYELAV